MSAPLETAVILLGVDSVATTAALAYVVRRVSPWPKPPAVTQPQGTSRGTGQPRAGSGAAGAPEGVPAANGATPPGGAT